MKKNFLLFVVLNCLFQQFGFAQGCSDAGFCSLQYHNEDNMPNKENKNQFDLGNVAGLGDEHTFINTFYFTFSRQLNTRIYWDVKLTSNYASGGLGSNFNAGDVFTNFSFTLAKNNKRKTLLKMITGVKIPLTSANNKTGNASLPMAYQSSLGTWDALLGMQYAVKNWEFTNAYQLPLTAQNKNTFLKEYSTSNIFPSSNHFRRKADVLLRAAYNIKEITKKIS